MIIRTNELLGAALNWGVAKSRGWELHFNAMLAGIRHEGWWVSGIHYDLNRWESLDSCCFSSDWSRGGPLLEDESISLTDQHGCRGMERWMATLYLPNDNGLVIMWGPTQLIAATRCFVASKLGDYIEIPDDLCPITHPEYGGGRARESAGRYRLG